MKKLVSFIILLFAGFLGSEAFGQDKILDRGGNEHVVIVTEIAPDSIYYREIADSVTQKIYSVSKKQIFMVTFKNGTKEVFPEEPVKKVEEPQLSRKDYYNIGQEDAKKNFKANGAFWGTFAATTVPMFAIGPLGGLAAGTAVSLSNPKAKNVIARNPEYKQNMDYMNGYNNRAKKKKLGNAAAGFGTGIGTAIVLIYTIIFAIFY